jgi:hypothetical protein
MPTRYGFDSALWQSAKAEAQAILVEHARLRRTITYGDLSMAIRALTLNPYSYAMVGMLTEIGRENEAQGKTALAALVVRKSDGLPGGGFFRNVLPPDAPHDDLERFWRAEFERACDDWSRD